MIKYNQQISEKLRGRCRNMVYRGIIRATRKEIEILKEPNPQREVDTSIRKEQSTLFEHLLRRGKLHTGIRREHSTLFGHIVRRKKLEYIKTT